MPKSDLTQKGQRTGWDIKFIGLRFNGGTLGSLAVLAGLSSLEG
jgi:hypothetical protein